MLTSKIYNTIHSKLGDYLIFTLLFISVFFIYCQTLTIWINYGGTSSHLFSMEIPFLLFVSYFFYFPTHTSIKKNTIAAFLAITPILVLYVWIDIFYSYLHRLPSFSDAKNLSLLASVSPRLVNTFVVCGIVMLTPWIVYSLKGLRSIDRKKRCHLYWSGAGQRTLLLFVFIAFSLSGLLSSYQEKRYIVSPMDIYSGTVRTNGRVMSVLHRERKSEEIRSKLASIQTLLSHQLTVKTLAQ